LKRLEEIAAKTCKHADANLKLCQPAALLLEKTTELINQTKAEELVSQNPSAAR
jgi:hypothetical protein